MHLKEEELASSKRTTALRSGHASFGRPTGEGTQGARVPPVPLRMTLPGGPRGPLQPAPRCPPRTRPRDRRVQESRSGRSSRVAAATSQNKDAERRSCFCHTKEARGSTPTVAPKLPRCDCGGQLAAPPKLSAPPRSSPKPPGKRSCCCSPAARLGW